MGIKQVIGIPMGSYPAPFFPNLFFYYHERKWIKKIYKADSGWARRFEKFFRFTDDLTGLNDCVEKRFHKNYPPELELEKENLGYREGSFLDLMITIKDKRFIIKLYNKRDSFPLSIVCMN